MTEPIRTVQELLVSVAELLYARAQFSGLYQAARYGQGGKRAMSALLVQVRQSGRQANRLLDLVELAETHWWEREPYLIAELAKSEALVGRQRAMLERMRLALRCQVTGNRPLGSWCPCEPCQMLAALLTEGPS